MGPICCSPSLQLWKGWSVGLVAPSCLWRGEKREGGPASFVSFVGKEAEKTSQSERGSVRKKWGVTEMKAYLEERAEKRRRAKGGWECFFRCLSVGKQLVFTADYFSPQRKDRWVGVAEEGVSTIWKITSRVHALHPNNSFEINFVKLTFSQAFVRTFWFYSWRFMGKFRDRLSVWNFALAALFFALHSCSRTGGHSSWLMIWNE